MTVGVTTAVPLPAEIMLEIVRYLHGRMTDLIHCTQLNRDVRHLILKDRRLWERLIIRTAEQLDHFCNLHHHNLYSLTLNYKVSLLDLPQVLRSMRFNRLRELHFRRAFPIDDLALQRITMRFPLLTHLSLTGAFISIVGWCKLLSKLSRLESLTVSVGCGSEQGGLRPLLEFIRPLRSLQSLDLSYSGSAVCAKSIRHLQRLAPQLRSLRLAGCQSIDRSALFTIAERWPQLHTLNLRGINFAATSSTLQQQPQPLAMLDCILSIANNIGDNLRSLTMDCRHLTDQCIDLLATGCDRLEILCLENGSQLSDAVCQSIGNYCRQLRQLQLESFPRLTANGIGLRMLKHLKRLQVLDLSDTACDNECLRLLSCPHLQKLYLNNCRLITASGLCGFVSGQKIKLSALHINNCYQIKTETVQFLRQQFPRCIISAKCT